MKISQEFLSELRDKIDFTDFISSYVNLKRSGSKLTGLCPFHNEKTPSFSVSPDVGLYYCFGCSAGGDIVTFAMQIENLDYIEAVKLLAARAGMTMPDESYDDSYSKLKTKIYEINREAARFFHKNLTSSVGKTALNYLSERKLSINTIRKFGIGFAPKSWTSLLTHLNSLGFSDDEIAAANLATRSEKTGKYFDRFRARIMFPILDLRGNVIAFGGRIMPDDEGAKYINSSSTPVFQKGAQLFALNIAKNSKSPIILTEGYMDVIALNQAGFSGAVAALGTAFTMEQARLLMRYTNEIIVTMDSDGAGQKATDRVIEICSVAGLNVRVLRIPDCKDPDEFIKKNGADKFKMLLEGASNDVEYRLNILKSEHDITTSGGQSEFLRESIKLLASLDNITMEIYAGKLANDFNISTDTIVNEARKLKNKKRYADNKKIINSQLTEARKRDNINPQRLANSRAAAAEESLIALLIKYPEFIKEAVRKLPPEKFITDFNKRVYSAISAAALKDNVFSASLISADFSPEEMGRIARTAEKVTVKTDMSGALSDYIRVILEEKAKLLLKSSGEITDEDMNTFFKNLANKKR